MDVKLVVAAEVEGIGDATMLASALEEAGIAHRVVQHLASGYDVIIPHAWGTLYVDEARLDEAARILAQVREDELALAEAPVDEEPAEAPAKGDADLMLLAELEHAGDAHLVGAALEEAGIAHRVVPAPPSGFGVVFPHAYGLLYVARGRLQDARELVLQVREDEAAEARDTSLPPAVSLVLVAELEGLGEAHLASTALEQVGIPHRVSAHHSSGLDVAVSHGWGMLYADRRRFDEALELVALVRADAEILARASASEDDAPGGDGEP